MFMIPSSAPSPKPKSVLRTDHFVQVMNAGKEAQIRSLLCDYRKTAVKIAADQWRRFETHSGFNAQADALADHRKASKNTRGAILGALIVHHNLPVAPPPPKDKAIDDDAGPRKGAPKGKRAALAPGLVDPFADDKARLGLAYYQMARAQVVGILESFISNRQNDFRDIVFGSTICPIQRHELLSVNKAKAWFDLDRPVHRVERDSDKIVAKYQVSDTSRRLARKIMSRVLSRHARPSLDRIGMVVDQRRIEMAAPKKAATFPFWLSIDIPLSDPQTGAFLTNVIHLPLRGNSYNADRKGDRKTTFQIIDDRKTGAIKIGVITDTAQACAKSRAGYMAKTAAISLDFGLTTLFASDAGDLLGRTFLGELKRYDAPISAICKHIQRSGGKPRDSRRYCEWTAKLRGFLKTEINRVFNRLIEKRAPGEIVLEQLNFQSPELSRRLNRIIQNCGRSIIATKLVSLKEQFGVEASEVAAAYTSQKCSSCGYVDKRNRRGQVFECLFCGLKLHADVNASRNIRARRSRPLGSAGFATRRDILIEETRSFDERYSRLWSNPQSGKSRRHGPPADPRLTNPYFRDFVAKARSPDSENSNIAA